jgi:histidinol-phosphate/aromatic aminotransferase/cobyric acid decarboxylase-like protein
LTRANTAELYADLLALPGIEPVRPDANFVLCRLTHPSATGPETARRLYVEHNILIKDCASKSTPEADRYLRIAADERSVAVTNLRPSEANLIPWSIS